MNKILKRVCVNITNSHFFTFLFTLGWQRYSKIQPKKYIYAYSACVSARRPSHIEILRAQEKKKYSVHFARIPRSLSTPPRLKYTLLPLDFE